MNKVQVIYETFHNCALYTIVSKTLMLLSTFYLNISLISWTNIIMPYLCIIQMIKKINHIQTLLFSILTTPVTWICDNRNF